MGEKKGETLLFTLFFKFCLSSVLLFYLSFFISLFLLLNLKNISLFLFSLTTPSNLYFLEFNLSVLQFFSSFTITVIEIVGKCIRPISLTCRLRANISARHLLSVMFFMSHGPVLLSFLVITRYYVFEIAISVIQRFVYRFLLIDYKMSF